MKRKLSVLMVIAFMKYSKLVTTIAIALISLMASTTAMAESEGNTVIQGVFSNRIDTQPSGSGDTILDNCGPSSGNQIATLKVKQRGDGSKVQIEVREARPNTLYTVWLRMRGNGPGGVTIVGNPMTGGGAIPLVPGYALDGVLYDSPPYAGNPNPTYGFITDANGDADFQTDLDFPVVGGAYPFQKASDEAVQSLIDAGSTWPLERIPSPIVNPEDPNISAPFLMRIISHCTDQLGHGLSPGTREAWFQYP